MEFYRIINKKVTETTLQHKILPENLDSFSESMFFLNSQNENFKAGTIWGEFLMSFDAIKNGIRFALLDCPNALTWTITTDSINDTILLHCTINKTQIKNEFLNEINLFLDEWVIGIQQNF